jgi:hypothetical protein
MALFEQIRICQKTNAYSSEASALHVSRRGYYLGFEERQDQLSFKVEMILMMICNSRARTFLMTMT